MKIFQVFRSKMDYSKITITIATMDVYPIIQNMARFYVYDMSEYMGWEIPANGLYECLDFQHYWHTPDTFPFLIHYDNELAGFAIVNKKGSDTSIDFNMAQFFILRKFKNKGIAKQVAHLLFNKFPGIWEVMVMPKNEGAYRFWRRIISAYTNKNFVEYTRVVKISEETEKNIFKFNSEKHK